MEAHEETLTFNYSRITPYIYVGTNLCCQGDFDDNLESLGIHADLSLEEKHVDNPLGVEYFLWIPVVDRMAPSLEQLECGIRFIDFCVSKQIGVYVHCYWGHGRSPTLVMAYFIAKGFTYENAYKAVHDRRPEAHLTEVQEARLKEFEASGFLL